MLVGCANAGKDQNVDANTLVTLDASASTSDYRGKITKYKWRQIRGTRVNLSNKNVVSPTFTAPNVNKKETLTFKVGVTETGGYKSPHTTYDIVNIIVNPKATAENKAPIASAETNSSTVETGQSITLTAANSTDSDGQIVSYVWTNDKSEILSDETSFTKVLLDEGTYNFTVTVTDDKNATASDTVTVTVTQPADTTPPVITLNGDANITLTVGEPYTELGATAVDDRDGNVTVDVNGTVDTNTIGQYTITYSAKDSAGNSAMVSRTITVNEAPDTTPPVITLNGESNITIDLDSNYTDAGASATDNKDGNLTTSIEVNGTVDTSKEGIYTLTYNVSDKAGNKAEEVKRVVTVIKVIIADTTPPVITLNGDANITLTVGDTYAELGATAVDDRDGNVTVDVNGTVDTNTIGQYTITYSAKDSAGNTVTVIRTVTVSSQSVILQSISVTPSPINLRIGKSIDVRVLGLYSDGSTQNIDADYSIVDTSIVSIDGSGTIDALKEGNTTLNVQTGTLSTSVAVFVGKELNTTNFNATHFGSTYTNQIPVDATLDNYDEKRFCMIAGQIKAEDGTPLQGARVSIHNHPEYGTTITDSNGSYAIPAEGGLQLTMRYSKSGFTTVDRNIQAPVQDWVRTDDVTMLEVDTKVTAVNLANASTQMHISTPVIDDRGERATTLVFDGVSKATVTSADGSTRELTDLNVRATEFKTPKSMPSDLPTESAYTYCSDLTVDGVRDDEEVSFDAPVIMYVDNFLGFEVGEIVPIGYYDRKDAKWKASDNGAVVKLLDTDNDGKVDALDSTGDDNPNDLNGDGSFADEVAGLVGNPKYVAGATYWRAAITHFTPWDHNWPYGPDEDSEDPDNPNIDYDDTPPNNCRASIRSYVTIKSRVFHEDIPVAGTDITLHYSSKRVDGYKYIIDTKVDTTSAPASALSAVATLEVGGKIFTKELALGEVNQLSFVWNGKDVLDSQMSGEVTARLAVKYTYNMVYYRSTRDFTTAWARVGSSATAILGRTTFERSVTKDIKLNVEKGKNNNAYIAKGWSLSNIHKATTNTLIKGDGNIEKRSSFANGIITTVAGNGSSGFSGDGGSATEASLDDSLGMSIDVLGNLYIADSINNRIRKVDTNGFISTVVGNGIAGFSGDGGSATEASLNLPRDIDVDVLGNLYIVDAGNNRIRKVDTNGIISTVAGNGEAGFSGDGGSATDASIGFSEGISVDRIGNLYIVDTFNNRIRKVDTNGLISTVAGNGELGFSGDGGNATEARLFFPFSVTTDTMDNLYISDSGNKRIRKVDTNGIISTVAGNGEAGFSGDGGIAIEARLGTVFGMSFDQTGNLYISDSGNNRIRKVDTNGIISTVAGNGEAGFSGDDGSATEASLNNPRDVSAVGINSYYILDNKNYRIRKVSIADIYKKYGVDINKILFQNQNNTAYIFDAIGKHLKTIDLHTSNALQIFTYDDNGHVVAITDQFNQTTTITRDANGYPTQITAPNGQVTTLTVNENGDLVEVKYEDNSKYTFSYYDGSLMDIMTDPNGNIIKHNYNDIGRIVEEIDGLNGSYQFLRNVSGGETFYSTILPEGETSTSKDVRLANGDIQSTMTLPTGETLSATFAADESNTSILRDGVRTNYTYTTDTLTNQRILASKEVTQPSGLKNSTSYATVYDGNKTHTNSKTQTITNNTKTTTNTTNYNNGTQTLTSPESRVATRTYDVDTLLTSSISTGSLTPTTYTYDNKGRVTKESTGTREITYTYDAKGNLATLTNERGQTTSYSYDVMDRLTQVTYPNNTTEHFSYDANGNLLTRTVPTPAEHTFTYNGADLRASNTSPLNKATTYSYDKSKNLTAINKPSGKTIVNNYDKGRLASIVTDEGTITYSYLFADKVGSITKGDEKFTFTYDGTLLTSTAQSGVLNHTTNFTYNNDFQVTSSTYAGATESYTYDNDGLLLSSGEYTLTRDTQNAYVTQLTDGTLTQTRSYNDFGEITQVSDNTFTYELSQRDQSGAITQKKETLNGTTSTYDYTFDDMGRLIEVQKNNAIAETYTYDNNGNRASATVNGTSITASYTLDDNLVVYGDNTYKYDEDGYLEEKVTPDGTTTYRYGTMGELLSVTTPAKAISYQHNANNQRVAKLVNGQVVEKYLWANLTTLLAVYDANDNLVQRFEYADSRMPIAMTKGADKYYLHYDQAGSLRAVSDSNHNIVKEIVYDTYGNILTDSNPSFTIPFGFAGGLYDADTKLTRFGYRDYDAYTGKWTAKDPIGFSGGDSNLYGYVLGDPVNFVDPNGLSYLDIPIREDPNKPKKPWEPDSKPKPRNSCCDWYPWIDGNEKYRDILDLEDAWNNCCRDTDVLPVCN